MKIATIAIAAALLLVVPALARAHCDTLDGPVARTARRALDTARPDLALAWVQPSGEAEIRAAYARARAVRGHGPEARALADQWFTETLVRVHRAGEGAPYTGLKPAGTDPGPALRAADAAVETGNAAPLDAVLSGDRRAVARARLAEVLRLRPAAERSVADGRAYVAAYVEFIHLVEGAADASEASPHPGAVPAPTPQHHDR
jgi:Family of unknown function (DUF6448)